MRALTQIIMVGVASVTIGCSRSQPAPATGGAGAPPSQPAAATPAPPTVPPAVLASANSSIPDLPDYPGATRAKYEREKEKRGGSSIEAKFETPDSFDVVQKFFTEAFPANGWQVGAPSSKQTPAKQEVEWSVTRQGASAKVELESKQGGGTSIKIKRNG